MGGGLISYGDALKAFRRGVYQFPNVWYCLVVCQSTVQLRTAMYEATYTLEASSLKVEGVNAVERKIFTERGGEIRFTLADDIEWRIMGSGFPHIIVLGELPDKTAEILQRHNRHMYVDEKHVRWDEATL